MLHGGCQSLAHCLPLARSCLRGAASAVKSSKSKHATARFRALSSDVNAMPTPPSPRPPPSEKRSQYVQKHLTVRHLLAGAGMLGVLSGGAYVSTRDEGTISSWLFQASDWATPVLRLLDPETAHHAAILAASWGLMPREKRPDAPQLAVTLWGRHLSNPIGLAAGFDKDAEAVEGLLGLGFGHVEVGSITPLPQPGNPRPRVFRIREEDAVINRYGFNSQGIVAAASRLGARLGRLRLTQGGGGDPKAFDSPPPGVAKEGSPGLVGVNLGKNKTTEDAASDYVQGVHTLAQYADYLVVNVSSPNTPGLRALQGRTLLQDLLRKVLAARDEMQWGEEGPPPLLLKVAPDLKQQDMEDIAAVALALRLDGMIVSNTTVERPEAVRKLKHGMETGGLSGRPLFEASTKVLHEMYKLTKGRVPLIGCGGVSTGEDAYKKIRAGASLVQIYTAIIYAGPGIVPRVKKELLECLERDGFKSVAEAVGADHRVKKAR